MAQCNGCLKDNVIGFCTSCETILFGRSKVPAQLNFNWDDMEKKIDGDVHYFSISGYQLKGFIGKPRGTELVPMDPGTDSHYIIKPTLARFNHADQSPANEHITMQIAKQIYAINIAKCAYMTFKNGSPAYITKRFDYDDKGQKLKQEDFTSILQVSHKYKDKSYEDAGNALKTPAEKITFFDVLIFNFLTANGDAHLKNFSLLETADGDMFLSPFYDLMNTEVHTKTAPVAMNLFVEQERAKNPKHDYSQADFIELGKRLGIKDKIAGDIVTKYQGSEQRIFDMVDKSFLNNNAKKIYKEKVESKFQQFFR